MASSIPVCSAAAWQSIAGEHAALAGAFCVEAVGWLGFGFLFDGGISCGDGVGGDECAQGWSWVLSYLVICFPAKSAAFRINELILGDGRLNAVLTAFRSDLKFRKEALCSARWREAQKQCCGRKY